LLILNWYSFRLSKRLY